MPQKSIVCLSPESPGRLTVARIDAGIRAAAARRRMRLVRAASADDAIAYCREAGCDAAIVLAASRPDCVYFVRALAAGGIHAILCNMSLSLPDLLTSHVLPDFTGMAYRLTSALFENGADRPVLVGWNPDSLHDALRLAGVEAACRDFGASLARIDYTGAISDAADECLARRDEFGRILCVNDFAARCLADHLPQGHAPMASLGGTAEFPGVLTAKIDYEALGEAAVSACIQLAQRARGMSLGITLPVETGIAPSGEIRAEAAVQDNFWRDATVNGIEKIARIRDSASGTDAAILALLLEGRTYERIAAETYMSLRTVKNHVRRLYAAAGCQNRREFTAMLGVLTKD